MNSMNVSLEDFKKLDYFFIPHLEYGHYMLFGFGKFHCYPNSDTQDNYCTWPVLLRAIMDKLNSSNTSAAPKQRTAFVIDSIGNDFEVTWPNYHKTLLAILNYFIPDQADREQWDLVFDVVKEDDKENTKAIEQRGKFNSLKFCLI